MVATRMRRRLLRHHLPLAVISLAGLLLLRGVLASDRAVFEWSMATAYVGLALLGASLMMGPLNVLRGRPNPVSFDLRRDTGIWAGLMSLAHVAVGMWVHMPRRFMYWLVLDEQTSRFTLRTDAFGLTNHAGLIAMVIALFLLLTSSDAALRALGRERWKGAQRANYALFVLVVAHGAVFQVLETRALPYVLLFLVITMTVMALQGAAFARRRSGPR